MKKLVILILAGLMIFLASCEAEIPEITPEQTPEETPNLPEVTDYEEEEDIWETSSFGHILHFYSEEELAEHFQNGGSMRVESADETRSYDVPTHYYKLKNPPPNTNIKHISISPNVNCKI